MKRTIAALVAGLVLGGAGGGIAGVSRHADQSKQPDFITLKPGTDVTIPGLDLLCLYDKKADFLHGSDPGPTMYCSRNSTFSPLDKSRAVNVTRYHFGVTDANGVRDIYWLPRAP